MKKFMVVMILVLVVVAAQAVTVTETQFDNVLGEFTGANASVTDQDTLQQTHPDHLIIESLKWNSGWVPWTSAPWGAPMWAAAKDAGTDWWSFNSMAPFGDDDGAGLLDYRWKDAYDGSAADTGRTLDSIDILVGNNATNIDRMNYSFQIDALLLDWVTWVPVVVVTGGSDRIGVGTKISIDNIGIDGIRGVRITGEGVWQAAQNNDGSANPNQFWGSTHVSEIDVVLTPEPATMALLGFGGLLLRRRKRIA